MERQLDARTILDRTMTMIERDMVTALLALATFTITMVVQDVLADWHIAMILLSLGVSLTLQYLVMRQAIASAGIQLAERAALGKSFCGTAIAVSLLSGLALLLLIVPGVYLYLRWSIATPLVLAEGETTDSAMSGSTARTTGHLVQIGLAQLVLSLPWFAGIIFGYFAVADADALSFPLSVMSAVLVSSGFIASWFGMVATYVLLRPIGGLEDVFA